MGTSPRAYWQYLHYMCYLGPKGFIMLLQAPSSAGCFLVIYSAVTYYFSAKMNRLILLMGPCCSALGGLAVANIMTWGTGQLRDFWEVLEGLFEEEQPEESTAKAKGKAKAK